MKRCAVLLLMPGMAWATDNCVLQDRTVSVSQVVIDQRGDIQRHVTTNTQGGQTCHVQLSVRIADKWHATHGSHDWDGNGSVSEACAVAVYRAEELIRAQVGQTRTQNEKILVCQDQLPVVPVAMVGQQVKIEQLRPHPNFLEDFYHRGTRCRWFVDTLFRDQEIHTYQGIVCETSTGWTVVDKF